MGSGYRVFTAGEVLTASNVQNYLQDQAVMVFGGTAARSSAIGTANFEEGMLTYLTDVDKLQVYTGAAFADVYPAAATNQGLTLINTTSFSAVSSQSVSDVFSSTYDNYLIELENTNSNSVVLRFRFKTASDDTAANYAFQHLNANGTSVTATRSLSQTYIELYANASSAQSTGTFIVRNPNKAKATHISAQTVIYGDYYAGAFFNLTSTQYTGFSIFPATNTTSGTVSVYGFNK
jgi:hypothetical protein